MSYTLEKYDIKDQVCVGCQKVATHKRTIEGKIDYCCLTCKFGQNDFMKRLMFTKIEVEYMPCFRKYNTHYHECRKCLKKAKWKIVDNDKWYGDTFYMCDQHYKIEKK